MAKFKVGDRVESLINDYLLRKGQQGTILEEDTHPFVRWDEYHKEMHGANGLCESGHGWSAHQDDLKLLKKEDGISGNEKIVLSELLSEIKDKSLQNILRDYLLSGVELEKAMKFHRPELTKNEE